jgi:hypothetical protein
MRTLTTLKYSGTQGDFLRSYMIGRQEKSAELGDLSADLGTGSLPERLASDEDGLEMRLELVVSIDRCLRQRQMI